jgi:hypothetical protein
MNFEGKVFKYLLDNFERYRLFRSNRDRWDEFLSWLYPRLKRSIDLYRDMGSSFDAYITSLVHSASKEYRCREADHHLTEYACWQARAEEIWLHENEPEYFENRKKISIPDDIRPRQILYLLLKSYYFVPDELVNRAAVIIGMEYSVIRNMIDEISKRRAEWEAEIREFVDRVHCQHYRYLAFQKRMNSAQPGTNYYAKMKERLERAKHRFFTMDKRLRGMRMNASNRMVAEVLGIPKGTVDSSLFAMRNHLALYTGLKVSRSIVLRE